MPKSIQQLCKPSGKTKFTKWYKKTQNLPQSTVSSGVQLGTKQSKSKKQKHKTKSSSDIKLFKENKHLMITKNSGRKKKGFSLIEHNFKGNYSKQYWLLLSKIDVNYKTESKILRTIKGTFEKIVINQAQFLILGIYLYLCLYIYIYIYIYIYEVYQVSRL